MEVMTEQKDRTAIKQGLKELIVERLNLDIEPATIEDEAPLFAGGEDEAGAEAEGSLALDSVEALEIVVGIEEKWGVVIEDDSVASEFYSIEALSLLVHRLLDESQPKAISA